MDGMVKAMRRSRPVAAAPKVLHSYMSDAAGAFRAGKDFGGGRARGALFGRTKGEASGETAALTSC
jgi:hypothetical protein